jgi:endo-1,4-beta-xylanase
MIQKAKVSTRLVFQKLIQKQPYIMIKNLIGAGSLVLLLSCSETKQLQSSSRHEASVDSTRGLKSYYSDYFPIGVAVSPRALKTDEAAVVLQHFNSLTAENAMKMGPIHPKEAEYFWRDADSIVAFAQRNNLKMRGHTLVWHNQTPAWLFADGNGNAVTKEVLLRRLKDHITTVVSRYKGRIYAWDVVNEAVSDKRDEYLRPSKWLQIIGEEYIAKAFQWAHEADPNAILFYNDYNEISPVKREKIFRLVKSLKDAGIPIHAVGLQAHWAVNEPSRGQLDSTLKRFSELGLPMQITELDISVYPKEHDARERKPEDANAAFSAEREQQQLEKYKMSFELFRKYRQHITGVTFWNISERYSWLDNFPVMGRKDYPLLFDKNLQPKKAYWEVVKW